MRRPEEVCAWSPFDITAAINVGGKDEPNAATKNGRHGNLRGRRCGSTAAVNVCDNVDTAGEKKCECRHFGFPLALRLCGNADIADSMRAREGGRGKQLQREGPVGVGTGFYIAPYVHMPSGCKCRKKEWDGGCRKEMERMGGMDGDGCGKKSFRYRAHRDERSRRRTHTLDTLARANKHEMTHTCCRAPVECVTRCLGPDTWHENRDGPGLGMCRRVVMHGSYWEPRRDAETAQRCMRQRIVAGGSQRAVREKRRCIKVEESGLGDVVRTGEERGRDSECSAHEMVYGSSRMSNDDKGTNHSSLLSEWR